MLLIGSRALKYHYPFSRKAKDYDFIATHDEVQDFLKYRSWKDISTNGKKVRAKVMLDRPTVFEFELIDSYPSSRLIYNFSSDPYYDKIIDCHYNIAFIHDLFLLKRSHVCFNIHWKKNIQDYLFLKSKINIKHLSSYWWEVCNMRFEEIKQRIHYKEPNFDLSNSEFFKKSERAVKRHIYHDSIHYATCFFDKPLFMSVKDDLSKAAMSESKVNSLSHDQKIKLIQEETMALAIERYILPAIKNKVEYDQNTAYIDTASKMVYNYLPMFLRIFAADNFMEILDLKIDYVKKFLDNVKNI